MVNIKNDDSCTFCAQTTETLVHVYWFCPIVQTFINSIKSDILQVYHIDLRLDIKKWFFLTNLNTNEAHVILLAKMVIYEARLKEIQPSITHLKNKIKWEMEVERSIATKNNKQNLFEEKWGNMIQILTTTSRQHI